MDKGNFIIFLSFGLLLILTIFVFGTMNYNLRENKVCYEYITEDGEIINVGFLQAMNELTGRIDPSISISADYNTTEPYAQVRLAFYNESEMESDKLIIMPYKKEILYLKCYRWVYVENAI